MVAGFGQLAGSVGIMPTETVAPKPWSQEHLKQVQEAWVDSLVNFDQRRLAIDFVMAAIELSEQLRLPSNPIQFLDGPECQLVCDSLHAVIDAAYARADQLEQQPAFHAGREAYEAYCRQTGWKSLVSGAPLPQWPELSAEIQSAWSCSAAWVAGRVLRRAGLMS